MLLQGLPLLSPSPECEEAIRPFICSYLFGSCDSDNQPHRGSQTCRLRKTERWCVCMRVGTSEGVSRWRRPIQLCWSPARERMPITRYKGSRVDKNLLLTGYIVNDTCYSITTYYDIDKCRGWKFNIPKYDRFYFEADSFSGPIICAKGYYLCDDNFCRPLCSEWVHPSGTVSVSNTKPLIL